jgi:hypothetical protein
MAVSFQSFLTSYRQSERKESRVYSTVATANSFFLLANESQRRLRKKTRRTRTIRSKPQTTKDGQIK